MEAGLGNSGSWWDIVPSHVSSLLLLSSIGEAEKIKSDWNPPEDAQLFCHAAKPASSQTNRTSSDGQSFFIVTNENGAASG